MSKDSIQVGIKVRPLLPKEIKSSQKRLWQVTENTICLENSQGDPFCFDHVFDQEVGNQYIFDKMAKRIVHSAVKGFNGTIFAYGQTSSGKTYTMFGDEDDPGVMVLAAKEIFDEIRKTSDTRQFLLRAGFIEIYNEKVFDLLNKTNEELKIHESGNGDVNVNCHEICITSEEQLLDVLETGNRNRTIGETNMNERSSRSHSILRLIIESREVNDKESGHVVQGLLHLVDLAGSERADQTGARGARLFEGSHINKSLFFLSTVIMKLSKNNEEKFINYRDSKLTRILQASLGGNAFTSIICTVKPNAIEETQSTLNFATSAKSVKNKPRVNENVSETAHMKRLEREINDLRKELEDEKRNKNEIKLKSIEHLLGLKEHSIIKSSSLRSNKINRRRTWCFESLDMSKTNLFSPPEATAKTEFPISRIKPPTAFYTPQLSIRNYENNKETRSQMLPMEVVKEEEIFVSGEKFNFDKPKTPTTPKKSANVIVLTPETPDKNTYIKKIEEEYRQLEEFTNLENKIGVNHDICKSFKESIDSLRKRNTELQQECTDLLFTKRELEDLKDEFNCANKRCEDYEIKITELKAINTEANEKIANHETEISKLKETIKNLEIENREAVELEFNYQRFQTKSKLRETELLDLLAEKDNQLLKFENQLKALQTEKLTKSQIELMQYKNTNGGGDNEQNVCIKCEDLQRVLAENEKVKFDLNKLILKNNDLQSNYEKSMADVLNAKQQILQLESTLNEYKEQALNSKECNELREDILKLRQELEKVNADYTEKDERCFVLNQELEKAQASYQVLQMKYENLENNWQKQEKKLDSIRQDYAALELKYNGIQEAYEALKECEINCAKDCRQLQQENDNLQNEIQNLKVRIEKMQQELLESLTSVNKNNDVDEKIKDLEIKCAHFQQENEQLSNDIMDHVDKNEALMKKYTILEEDWKTLKQEKEIKEVDQMSIDGNCKQLEEKLKTFEQQQNHLNLEKSNLETQIVDLKTQLAEKLENSQQVVSSLEVKLISLENEQKLWFSEKSNLETQISDLKTQLAENVENKNENVLLENLKSLEIKQKTLEHEKQLLLTEKSNLEIQILDLKTQLEQTVPLETFKSLEIKLKSLEDEQACWIAKTLKLKTVISNLETELAEKTEKLSALEVQNNEQAVFNEKCLKVEYEFEKTDLRNQISKLENELCNKIEQYKFLENENDQLKETNEKLIESSENEIKSFKDQIKRLTRIIFEKSLCLENLSSIAPKDLSESALHELELSVSYNAEAENSVDIEKLESCWNLEKSVYEKKITAGQQQMLQLFTEIVLKRMELLKIDNSIDIQNHKETLRQEIEEKVKIFYCFKTVEHENLIDDWIYNNNFCLDFHEISNGFGGSDSRRISFGNVTLCPKELGISKTDKEQQQQQQQQRLSILQAELKQKEEQCQNLQLDLLEKLTNAEDRFHANLRDYNNQWEKTRLQYEEKIQKLEKALATQNSTKINTEDVNENENETSLSTSFVSQHSNNNCSTPTTPDKNISQYLKLRRLSEKSTEILNECQEKIASLSKTLEEKKIHNQQLELEINEKTNLNEMQAKEIDTLKNECENLTILKTNFEKALMKTLKERETAKIENIINYETEHLRNLKISNFIKLNENNTEENDFSQLLSVIKNIEKGRNLKIQALEEIAEKNTNEAQSIEIDAEFLQVINENFISKADEINKHRNDIEYLAREIDGKIEILEKINENLKSQKLKFEMETEIQQRIAEKQNRITELEALVKEGENLNEQFLELHKEMETFRNVETTLNANIKETQVLKANIEEKQVKIMELETENQKLTIFRGTCEKLEKENENLKSMLNELQQLVGLLKIEIDEKQKKIVKMSKQKLATQNETLKLQNNNKRLETETSTLKAQNELTMKAKSIAENELKQVKQLNVVFEHEKSNDLEIISDLEEQHQNLEDKIEELTQLHETTISNLELEKHLLNQALSESRHAYAAVAAKAETFELKVESLSQELHESKLYGNNLKKTLQDYHEIENMLQKMNEEKTILQNQIDVELKEKNSLKTDLIKIQANEEILKEELKVLKAKYDKDIHIYESEKLELESKMKELTLQRDELKFAYLKLQSISNEYKEKYANLEKANSTHQQQSINIEKLKAENAEILLRLQTLHDEVEQSKQMHKIELQQRIDACDQLRKTLDLKEKTFKEIQTQLESTNSCLQEQNKNLSERLEATNELIKKYENSNFESANNTLEISSNSATNSSNNRRSPMNKMLSADLSATMKNERKNRRRSTHDENRRQSATFTPIMNDQTTMTDPISDTCNCNELNEKLKKLEIDFYIKSSQVTALKLELRNNPLKLENANLIKRIQEEQQKYRTMSTKFKARFEEQAAKIQAVNDQMNIEAKITVDRSTLTDCMTENLPTNESVDNSALKKLEGKYEDIKKICRLRYNKIVELEKKLEEKNQKLAEKENREPGKQLQQQKQNPKN